MITLYRAAAEPPRIRSDDSRRPPGNVPYVVDNLWEWARPAHLLSRRGSAYASPTPELALFNAGNKKALRVFKLYLEPGTAALQLSVNDARLQADCAPHTLRRKLFELLKPQPADSVYAWASQPLTQKLTAAPLFLPALSREELESLLGTGGPLAHLAVPLREAVTFWNDVYPIDFTANNLPNLEGEVFFAADVATRWELA